MSKQIILLKAVEGLGREGDVVAVAEGYARNYLFPRRLATVATDAATRRLAKLRREREERERRDKSAAAELANRMNSIQLTIPAKASADDRLYGSVGVGEIVAALERQEDIRLDRRQVLLAAPLREVGIFKVEVQLHPEVTGSLAVWVVRE